MGFWVVVAEIVKVLVTIRKYAYLLTSFSDKNLVEGVITSFLSQGIISALVKAGVPVDKLNLLQLAEEWANSELAKSPFLKHGLILAPDILMEDLSAFTSQLEKGNAVAGSIPPNKNIARTGDPVLLSSGEFERAVSDLELNGAGITFDFRRIYRSRVGYFGPLGFNWDHSYNQRLRQDNEFVLTRLSGDLTEVRFVKHPRFGEPDFSYYVPPDGVNDVLISDAGGSYVLRQPQGISHYYEPTTDPGQYRLKRIQDRFSNFLEFGYSTDDLLERVSINSPARYVQFQYDERDRLESITDHTGRFVTYTYDDWGYLERVTGPAYTAHQPVIAEQYENEQVGQVRKLTEVLDWKGRILVENEYEQDQLSEYFGFIIKQTRSRGESTFFMSLSGSNSIRSCLLR
mgnify:CR=1 FL=1